MHRLLAGAGFVTVAAVAGQGATLVTNVLLARMLGSSGFGAYGFLQASLNNLSLVAQMSFGLLATKYLAEYGHRDPDRAGRMLGFGTVATLSSGIFFAAVFVLTSPSLYGTEGMSDAEVVLGVGAIALAIPLAALTYFQTGVFQGLGRFRIQATLSLWQAVLAVAFPVAGAHLAGIAGATIGIALYAGVRSTTNALVIHRIAVGAGFCVALRPPREFKFLARNFALPASLTGLTSSGSQWLGAFWLLSQPDGSRELGLYSVGMIFRMFVILVPAQLGAVALSQMARHLAERDSRDFGRVSFLNLLLTSILAVAICVILVLLSPFLLVVFGDDFADAQILVYVILVGSVFEAIAISIYPRLPSQSRMWTSFFSVAVPRDLCFLAGIFALVGSYLGFGLASAYTLSQIVGLFGVIHATRRTVAS